MSDRSKLCLLIYADGTDVSVVSLDEQWED